MNPAPLWHYVLPAALTSTFISYMAAEVSRSASGGDAQSGTGQALRPETGTPLSFEFPDAEVVFGVVCAVGVNYGKVTRYLSNLLGEFGYKPNAIRLSDFLKGLSQDLQLPNTLEDTNEFLRIRSRMKPEISSGERHFGLT